MKIKNKRVKRGMTLVEVIISVTLLSILIIPLSTLVLSGFKNSKNGENKQKAVYVGQKVLEEIKAYDNIKLKEEDSGGDKYFELLDGDKVKKDGENDKYTAVFQRNIYGNPSEPSGTKEPVFNVELEIKKNDKFDYSNINSVDYTKAGYKLKLLKKEGANKLIDEDNPLTEIIVNDDLVMDIKSDKLEIYNRNNSNTKITIPIKSGQKSIIFINQDESFAINNLNIEIINDLASAVDINLVTNSVTNVDSSGNKRTVNIISSKGNIMFSKIDTAKEAGVSDMYNYSVVVKDSKNKILFEGDSSSNLIIK